MAEESSLLRVGLAQIDCRLGDVEGNLARHLSWIAEGRRRGVDLLVFPELSLTGYRLLHLTPRVSLRPEGSPVVAQIAEAAGTMSVVFGLVERDDRGVLHNSALLVQNGVLTLVHRKIYLPTYGIFQEERFLGAGRRLGLADLAGSRVGILICEDLWHPSLASRLAVAGAKLLIVPSAGPGRIGSGDQPESQEAWELVTRSTALLNTCWVVYCNRVGWEEGSFYTGGSHVVRPGGEMAVRGPILEEHLLVAEIDLRDADRLRWKLPLIDDERTDLEGPSA
ncbi:MAG TPA: nitrilase-related carbon-nitrogen hydrolase [Thermoanaerobaculia bacterium]|nr:nitrilase-related carbon-nitrogen hydrolase [Thermoanaerobaculia bacterium]